MMIDANEFPAVRAQLERDVEALKERHAQRAKALAEKMAPQYARAPAASDQQTGTRPPATQGSTR